jgi:hypothetical protein
MAQRLVFLVLLSVATLQAAGCSASLFKVKPVTELPALADSAKHADAGGVTIRVAPLLTDEESQDLFEANLPLSGVLPVRLELRYESGVPVETKQARFRLRDTEGREWKLLSPKQAISRILKANGVFAYNPHSRKQFEKEFTAYALDVKTPLSANDSTHQGFLFFQSPTNRPVESVDKLTLTLERLPQTATIDLN